MQTLLCHNDVGHASYPKSGWTSGQKYVTNLFLHLPDDPVSTLVTLYCSSSHEPVVTDVARDDYRL